MQEKQKRYQVSYDKNGFPSTLLDWRNEPRTTNFTARYARAAFVPSKGVALG